MYVQCVGHFRIVLSVVYETPNFPMVLLTRGIKHTVFEFSSFYSVTSLLPDRFTPEESRV